jgi:hypothetical protein
MYGRPFRIGNKGIPSLLEGTTLGQELLMLRKLLILRAATTRSSSTGLAGLSGLRTKGAPPPYLCRPSWYRRMSCPSSDRPCRKISNKRPDNPECCLASPHIDKSSERRFCQQFTGFSASLPCKGTSCIGKRILSVPRSPASTGLHPS